MQLISGHEYQQLIRGASELERDAYGPKVWLRPDGRIVKLFRIKRLLSLSLLYPYSLRFARNAERLNGLGVRSVVVERTFFCPAIRRHGVIYPLLEGQPLVGLLEKGAGDEALLERLAAFIALLHAKKIYFRSLHLGNVLLLPDGGFGLIDVADMRIGGPAFSLDKRRRNFRHLLRLPAHRVALEQFGLERFFGCYCRAAGLDPEQWKDFLGKASNE